MTEPVKIANAPDRLNAFMEDLNGNLYAVCQNNATYKIINEDMKERDGTITKSLSLQQGQHP